MARAGIWRQRDTSGGGGVQHIYDRVSAARQCGKRTEVLSRTLRSPCRCSVIKYPVPEAWIAQYVCAAAARESSKSDHRWL
jgi:hypothetical protein